MTELGLSPVPCMMIANEAGPPSLSHMAAARVHSQVQVSYLVYLLSLEVQ